MAAHKGSQEPTGVSIGMKADFPGVKEGRAPEVEFTNGHPHQEHSAGYDASSGYTYDNHGFESVHIVHGSRDKGGEHHPQQAFQ
jgi:hypothetical protein